MPFIGADVVVVVEAGRRRAAKLDLAVSRLRSESWRLQAFVKLKNASTSAVYPAVAHRQQGEVGAGKVHHGNIGGDTEEHSLKKLKKN